VSSVDLYPTILAAAGIDTPEGRSGVNLLPVIRGQKELEREYILGESFAHDIVDLDNPQTTLLYRWVIQDQWKLILRYDGTTTRYKAVHEVADPAPQLFNLIADPHEETNLAVEHPQLVAQLVEHLSNWWTVDERGVQLVP
jgi:arylsulfatase A-like enzyme